MNLSDVDTTPLTDDIAFLAIVQIISAPGMKKSTHGLTCFSVITGMFKAKYRFWFSTWKATDSSAGQTSVTETNVTQQVPPLNMVTLCRLRFNGISKPLPQLCVV